MGYRMSVKGNLLAENGTREKITAILEKRELEFRSTSAGVDVDHSDRNMNPGDHRVDKALRELAAILEVPQTLTLWDEFEGEREIVVGHGRVKEEVTENVWSQADDIPTPEQILSGLRVRGLAARLTKVKGRRGGARQYEFQPTIGGPSCRVTVKRRFWDSFDLLSVPEVTQKLCLRYALESEQLRDKLYGSTFGLEVRNPATGSDVTDALYESLLDVIEEITIGIRTTVG